jgi:nucleotidyltransferase/DNA polymerase involved in DNA repair
MNAFFISCEMTRNPSLVGIPAAVADLHSSSSMTDNTEVAADWVDLMEPRTFEKLSLC